MGMPVAVAGGSLGWGGLIDRGDRIIPSHCASDLLNVYEEKGVTPVLKKRTGYTKTSGAFVLGGEYTATASGSKSIDGITYFKLSQEVYLTGTGSGADVNFAGAASELVVAISMQGTTADECIMKLYSVDGSGHPNTLLATSLHLNSSIEGDDEKWIYAYFPSVALVTANICIVLEPVTLGSPSWYYSDVGPYAPGGARVSSYWSGSAWVDIVGTDFKFKFYHKISNHIYKSEYQYLGTSNTSEYNEIILASALDQYVTLIGKETSYLSNYTVFLENVSSAYTVQSSEAVVSNVYKMNIFPMFSVIAGTYVCRLYNTRLILGSENYLFQTSFNGFPLRITKYATANINYRFANTPYGLLIAPDKNIPQVWGSTTYPVTGYVGSSAFSGLTNPITLSSTVAWHQNRAWWGNVTINSVVYPNLVYYSGLLTPEAGYTDTGYLAFNSTVTAIVDAGDYMVVSDLNNTYAIYGGGLTATSMEKIQHPVGGGVSRQEAMCFYADENGYAYVFGWGNRGIFQIDKSTKQYIYFNLQNKFSSLIQSDISVCPDYRRGLVLFSYTEAGVRKVLAYDVSKQSWWAEDITATQMISTTVPNKAIPQIYGIKNAEVWTMYTGNQDDGVNITGYYKCGPAYLNSNRTYVLQNIWFKHRNEPATTTANIKWSNDYETEVSVSKSLRNTALADNTLVLHKVDATGSATSTEIKIHQSAENATFAISDISAEIDTTSQQLIEQDL